jgi:dUTP pyrophosphatase
MVVFDRQTLMEFITQYKLVTNLIDIETQVSPNGVELTLHKVYHFKEAGVIDFSNEQRRIPQYEEIPPRDGRYALEPGAYLVTYNEIVRIPADAIAIGRPRSSLLRSGVTVESAVWDAGYEGRSRGLLIVHNPRGFIVMQNARLLHLLFIKLTRETQPYTGVYQGES